MQALLARAVPRIATLLAGIAVAAASAGSADAAETRVAVAANFTTAVREIGALFETRTTHRAIFSFGATGQLYTQISQGAPFDVLLAADQERPRVAIEAGLALPGSRFTYATGRIVLFSIDRNLVTGPETLRAASFTRIAIANPSTAPYGAAAIATMETLGVYNTLRTKIVQGASIAQTYQFVGTGNAELGFVALSQIIEHDRGSRWTVPEHLHEPIAQDAVLLMHGAENAAAKAFLDFLRGSEAGAVKARFGYGSGG